MTGKKEVTPWLATVVFTCTIKGTKSGAQECFIHIYMLTQTSMIAQGLHTLSIVASALFYGHMISD